jgi:hypothetical protein
MQKATIKACPIAADTKVWIKERPDAAAIQPNQNIAASTDVEVNIVVKLFQPST